MKRVVSKFLGNSTHSRKATNITLYLFVLPPYLFYCMSVTFQAQLVKILILLSLFLFCFYPKMNIPFVAFSTLGIDSKRENRHGLCLS